MYDHLDGDVPFPGDDVREAVHHRASVLRRRRWAAAGSAGTAVALVGVLLLVNLSGTPTRKATLFLDDPTPTVTASAEPTPDLTDEPRPTPAPTPAVTPVVTEAPSVEVTPSPSDGCVESGPETSLCRDGKPGWAEGDYSCRDVVASDLPDATATDELFDGVTVTFVLPRTEVEAGKALPGVLRFHSARSDRVTFGLGPPGKAVVFGAGGGGAWRSGNSAHDNISVVQFIDLEPGETKTHGLGVLAASCGAGEEDPDLPLPAGKYSVGRTLGFIMGRTVAEASPSVSAATPEATATESAAPTVTDGPVPESGRFEVRLDVTVV